MYLRLRFKELSLTWLHLYTFSYLIFMAACEDHSDFTPIPASCPDDHYHCKSGECLPNKLRCNSHADCADGDDEVDCSTPIPTSCPDNHYQCYDGHCVPNKLRCDSHVDCADGDDEFDCALFHCLAPEFFRCNNGHCIDSAFVCNDDNDCGDFSDEKDCSTDSYFRECGQNEFRCENNHCIPDKWFCDGKIDCDDESDEVESACAIHAPCKSFEFRCRNQKCIPEQWHCDGERDCSDGSDEVCSRRVVKNEDCNLDNRMFLCKDHLLCLEMFEVCNDRNDCFDNSDEGGNCSAPCTDCQRMEQQCFRTPDGPVCGCQRGFKRVNGLCKDIDECQEFGLCYQKCANNPGSYNCLCDPGYVLQRDQRSCKVANGEAFLVYSTTSEVRAFLLSSQIYWPVVSDQKHVIGVAFDGHHIYWTEVYHEEEAILRSREDGSKMEVVVSAGLGIPEDLAVDWVTKNLYFTDSQLQRIGVCNNDGSACAVIHARYLDKVRGIALHPREGLMYWSDWGSHPVIARSGMDGSSVTDFVNSSLHWPNGIVVDYSNDRLYWVDAKLLTIESIRLDGTDRRKILENTIEHPFSIAVFEDLLYWSDWDGKQIEACNKFTGKDRQLIVRSKKNRIYGIHVFHAVNHEVIDNPCENNPCSDICLLSPKSTNPQGYKCACPENKVLKNDNWCAPSDELKILVIASSHTFYQLEHKQLGKQVVTEIPVKDIGKLGAITYNPITGSILMSDTVKKEILSLQLDTLQLSTVVSGDMGRIEGLAFDHFGNNLYFTDSEYNRVEVVSFHSWDRKVLLQRLGGDVPTDIAVLPEEGVMFISLFNLQGSHIDKFSMSGKLESRAHVIENDLFGPYLPLHYSHFFNQVFWADSHTKFIERTDSEGLIRHKFRTLLTEPVSLTSIDSDLFWTNHNSQLLYWADASDTATGNKLIDLGNMPEGDILRLTAVTGKISHISHPCTVNNGNCSHICLVDKKDRVCACPSGMLLNKDGLNCLEVPECKVHEFLCYLSSVPGLAKHCVHLSNRCDHNKDCPNGEDEIDCPSAGIQCPRGKISCNDGSKCIEEEKKCNVVYDCPDHSDELNCDNDKCDNETMFECFSGECILALKRCDLHTDCKDGSDEHNCESNTCKPVVQFRCDSGACIPSTWVCDRQPDCTDTSDEHAACDVKETCKSNQMTCENGQCIDKLFRCDDAYDCDDESDERDCHGGMAKSDPELKSSKPRHRCDEHTEFECHSKPGTCVPIKARCNSSYECPEGEDEVGCLVCNVNEFQCDNGKCIPKSWTCDKTNDCGDNSDESTTACVPEDIPEEVCNEFQCANKHCLHFDNVCNGHDDCGDKSDEGGKCGYSCKNAGCTDKCRETPTGPVCTCIPGYTLMGDGKGCTDIDECASGLHCSQYCKNTLGGFECSCKYPEYSLREDRMSCKAKGTEMKFLFAYQNQIRTMWGSHSHLGVAYKDPNYDFKLSGLAADVRKGHIYWTSEKNDALFRVKIDKRDVVHNVSSLMYPSKIAVDWITGNVYVVEGGTRITICNFENEKFASIYTTEQTLNIDSLAVDPITRTMFWSERMKRNQPFSKIYKADLSGANVTAIVTKDLEVVSSIFIDTIHNYIYWAELKKQKIERCSFNGTHRQTVFQSPDIPIDIAMFEDNAYLLVDTNSMIRRRIMEKSGNVWRCGLYGARSWKCDMIRISPINFGLPYHFEIMHEALQPVGTNGCKNMNCSELCVLSASGSVCLCPDGTRLNDNMTCPSSTLTSRARAVFGQIKTGMPYEEINNDVDDNGPNYLKWMLILVMCLTLPAVVIFLYHSKLLSRCRLPNLCDNKASFPGSIHFENTAYGLSPMVDNSHAESQFHHTKLNPGDHQYENINTDVVTEDGKVNIKYDNNGEIIRGNQVLTGWSRASLRGSTGTLVEDNGSSTSSIEYSDVHLDLHKAPLLR